MKKYNANLKVLIIFLAVIIIGGIVSFNVFFTTVSGIHLRSGINVLVRKAGSQELVEVLQAKRGNIKDRNGNIIAQDIDAYTLVLVLSKDRPGNYAYVENREFTAKSLAPILGMSEEAIMSYLNLQDQGVYQTYLGEKGKNLTLEQKKAIEAIEYTPDPNKKTTGLPGVEFEKTVSRVYIPGRFASTLLGFATYDSSQKRIVGQVGIEAYLNEELTGKDGKAVSQKDRYGYALPGTTKTVQLATNGKDVYLTLDKDIQESLENTLLQTVEKNGAKTAWAVVMEVETGKILGYGGYPSYDLNQREEVVYFDMPSMLTFEPGSSIKPFVYASAIEEGVYKGSDTVHTGRFCYAIENGKVKYTGSSCPEKGAINDAWRPGWGDITFDEALMRSSNTAIAKLLTEYLDVDKYWEYLEKLHFFQPTGIEGLNMSEESGIKNNNYPIDKIAGGFGQGSSVTVLQMMQAYSALFNDGIMVKPYYIDKIVDANNQVTYEGKTEYANDVDEEGNPIPVFSKSTCDQVKELMKSVMQNKDKGTGYGYNIEEFNMIGKTGTGEIAANNSYGDNLFTSNVMAAAPADDPKIMVYYGFQASETLYFDRTFFKNLFTTAYEVAGIRKTDTPTTPTTYENWQEYEMPVLKNHTKDYATKKLSSMQVHSVVIGDGNVVVDQYPSGNANVSTNQNVFLLTNSTNIVMPNMVGWSYKDVMLFSKMSKIPIVCNGTGIVKSQSVTENTAITQETEIIVELE